MKTDETDEIHEIHEIKEIKEINEIDEIKEINEISISPSLFGWGVFLFGTQQIDIGAGGPSYTFVYSKSVDFDKNQTLVR